MTDRLYGVKHAFQHYFSCITVAPIYAFLRSFYQYIVLQTIFFPTAGLFGLYQEENATDRSDWNRKSIEQISGIRTIQNGGGGIN